MNRRDFLRRLSACGCGVTVLGSFPELLLSDAHAATGNGTKLLLINMNGGWDGLSVFQPSTGAVYDTLRSFRPTLSLDASQLIPLGGGVGLHPSLGVLKSLYDANQLTVVQSVGYDNMSRSHQDAEVAYARGVSDRLTPTASGFISRLGSEYNWQSLQAVSVTGNDPAFVGSSYSGIQVPGLEQFRYVGDYSQYSQENHHRLDTMYAMANDWFDDPARLKEGEVTKALDLAVNTADMLQDAIQGTSFHTAYPNTFFGRRLKDIEILFSTPSLSTEIGYIRRGGFDTHSNQNPTLVPILNEFHAAFSTFVTNMVAKGLWNNLIVCIISEFGRTNRENGSAGTDHGGAVPIVITGGAAKSAVIGSVTSSDLTDNGWLPMKYNVVSVYRQILAKMGYDPDRVFSPASGQTLPGLF